MQRHEAPVEGVLAATVVAHAIHDHGVAAGSSVTRLVSPPNEFATDVPATYRHEVALLEEPFEPTVHADRISSSAPEHRHGTLGRYLWGRVQFGAYEVIFVLMAFSVTVMLTTPALVELVHAIRGSGS